MSTSVASPTYGMRGGAGGTAQQPLNPSPLSTSPSASAAAAMLMHCTDEARARSCSPIHSPLSSSPSLAIAMASSSASPSTASTSAATAAASSPFMLSSSPSSSFMYRGPIDIKYLAQRQEELTREKERDWRRDRMERIERERERAREQESSSEEEEEEEEEDEEEETLSAHKSEIVFDEELNTWTAAAPRPAQVSAACASIVPVSDSALDAICGDKAQKPCRRHISWGDDKGGSLTQARHFYREDAPLRCSSAHASKQIEFAGLKIHAATPPPREETVLLFDNSCLPTDLAATLAARCVTLESVCLRAPLVFLTIRVLNVSYEKHVFVRVTSDNWQSHVDIEASYLPGSSSPKSDRFYATLSMPGYQSSQGLQFALCFRSGAQEYWDSNNGRNYAITVNKNTITRRFGVNLDSCTLPSQGPYY